MFFSGIARAIVGGVALDDRAVYFVDHRTHEFRMEEVLVALFAGMNLDRNLAWQLHAKMFIELHDVFWGDFFGEIYFGFAHREHSFHRCELSLS